MKREKLALFIYLSAFVIPLYMMLGIVMVILTNEAIVLGRSVEGNTLLMMEAPIIALVLLSLAFFKRKARFFASISLFSAFVLMIVQRADITIYVIPLAGLVLSLFALVVGFPKDKQQVSLNERIINAVIGVASIFALAEAWNFVWPNKVKLLIFLLGAIGALLMFSKNRVIASGGIPLLATFYCSAAYALYALNYNPQISWQTFWAASVVLITYSLIPLRKLLR
ncbi:hypothetical protein [Thermococcus paralvinellae]|uniref:Uncharacterized protein n=1 Tax=Thermococcus paralvinellae TaxID=582419 RepID=W0I4E0_9EURY|nr:hypothetical protein [Thermococcus paralvinellae]AHF80941.1 Hypothetical protein TES1_1565 [Thermococcus paralvinellae]